MIPSLRQALVAFVAVAAIAVSAAAALVFPDHPVAAVETTIAYDQLPATFGD